MITGGTGNVDVSVSALLSIIQNLVTPEFDSFAASEARFSLQVFDVDSFHSTPGTVLVLTSRQGWKRKRLISQLFTLQFNQQYTLQLFVGAN